MGLIIKNGIRYFGDNSVELTQAQYDALSQEEKLNGTTYYITDGQNITTASAVSYNNTASGLTATDVQGAIDEVSAVSSFTPTSVYGNFSFKAINGIKCLIVSDPKGLAANALTTLEFTLPEKFRPIENICYFNLSQPSDNYTIRLLLKPSGTVQFYNYGTNTGTLNMSYTGCYI